MTTGTRPSPLTRLLTGGVLALADILLAFALIPGLAGAQTTEEDAPTPSEEMRKGRNGPGLHGGGHQAVQVTADLTGTATEDVIDALQQGASLASYAADNGVSRDALVTSIVEAMQAKLDERVAEGMITPERAAELAAEMDAKVEDLVDREGSASPGCNQDDSGEETSAESI